MGAGGLFAGEVARADEGFVRVAVERGVDLGEGLTYRGSGLSVGQRVEVPLGRGDARAAGFVVRVGGAELLDGLDPERVKRVLGARGSRLPAPLVELARWMSGYYVCPLGMVLATMMPAAVKAGTGVRTQKRLERAGAADADVSGLPASAREAWAAIAAMPEGAFPAEAKDLAHGAGASNAGPVNRLVRAGLLREVEVRVVRAPEAFWEDKRVEALQAAPSPTAAQAAVVEGIGAGLGEAGVHLLRGVTGSGKTEVYLRLIERVLEAGRSAIVLVPEIALTPQTAGRFLDRFGRFGVAVLHSGLAGSSRNQQWSAAASGAARVVVGARSGVFAPVPGLGLIVVDEEHDSGYKQDQLPRYHARDVAVVRGRIEGVPVVLGSATPSMESWANAQRGRYRLWELTERVGGGRMPRVTVVDLAAERRARRREGGEPRTLETIGPTLGAALERVVGSGGQAVLLLNRRGFASYIACPDAGCGWTLGCDSCDTKMVVHRGRERAGHVRCHHCLAEQLLPKACPVCGKKVIELGAGTQRVEREIEFKFGTTLGLVEGQTFARVDSDTMRSARDYFEVLGKFGRGELKVLLGTQMVAKGLDYPNVRLVGVVNADTSIGVPDFRACERTFQLVTQVAGRAGRGAAPGEVIVQTMSPAEPAIRLAAEHDFVGFARRELAIRAASRLPPAWRMARVVVRDEDVGKAEAAAAAIAAAVRERAGPEMMVQGPAPCPIARVAGQFRFGVEVFAPSAREVQRVLGEVRAMGLVKSDAATAVDVDPVAVL